MGSRCRDGIIRAHLMYHLQLCPGHQIPFGPYMETWCSALHEVNLLSIVLRISIALLVEGLLGAERGLKNRTAGFMTYVLVCMGAAMIMLTNHFIVTAYTQADPTHMAAQVVSGISFWVLVRLLSQGMTRCVD